MPLLDLLRKQLGDARRGPANGAPDPRKCLVVSEVAAVSPAGLAGVAKGDLVVSIDGKPAVETEADVRPLETGRHSWRFRSAARVDEILLETHLPLGVRLRPTAAAVEATHGTGSDPERLVELWEAGEWEVLERVASGMLKKRSGAVLRTVSKAVGGDSRRDPSLVLAGAAMYELGRREDGLGLVREYLDNYERYWTTNYMAIGRYVLGREALRRQDRREGLELLRAAFDYHDESDRIATALEQATGERPMPERAWRSKPFPTEYAFPVLGGSGQVVSLQRTLAQLGPGRLLTVCALGSYRANGPYNEFVDRYHWFTETLGLRVHEMHVITSEEGKERHADWWFGAEERARNAGVRFSILLDEEDLVAGELRISHSPSIFLVDRRGVVVHEGTLEETDIWDALVAADEDGAPPLPSSAEPGSNEVTTSGEVVWSGGSAGSRRRGDAPVASCLAVSILFAVTAAGFVLGGALWGWVGAIGCAVVAGFLALMIYGFMLPPAPDEER